jgi:hypothetical protein
VKVQKARILLAFYYFSNSLRLIPANDVIRFLALAVAADAVMLKGSVNPRRGSMSPPG